MKELKVGDRFLLPYGDDGRLIEVQERDRHSLCDGKPCKGKCEAFEEDWNKVDRY